MKDFKDLLEKTLNKNHANLYLKNTKSDFPFPMGTEEGLAYMQGCVDTLQWVLEMFPEIKEK